MIFADFESENAQLSWECGTDDISKSLSHASVDQSCPDFKGMFVFKRSVVEFKGLPYGNHLRLPDPKVGCV